MASVVCLMREKHETFIFGGSDPDNENIHDAMVLPDDISSNFVANHIDNSLWATCLC